MPISPTLPADQALAELLVRQRLSQDPTLADPIFDLEAAAPRLPDGPRPRPEIAPIPMPQVEPVREEIGRAHV